MKDITTYINESFVDNVKNKIKSTLNKIMHSSDYKEWKKNNDFLSKFIKRKDVQDHIVKVCQEIITNYDVDGMLFDDYHYDSASMNQDASEYSAYKAAGGAQSQADWRRSNVHSLMKKLYTMIQDTKPWVRFGQAPPGGTFRDASLSAKYGIESIINNDEDLINKSNINIETIHKIIVFFILIHSLYIITYIL